MIRGFTAVLNRDSPVPAIPILHRRAGVKLAAVTTRRDQCDRTELWIQIENTDYSFKVVRNISTVDKDDIVNGIVRIGFAEPELDVVISCNATELKAFIDTVEIVKDISLNYFDRPLTTAGGNHIACFCNGFNDFQAMLCWMCVKRFVCKLPGADGVADSKLWTLSNSISVASFPYLKKICADYCKLVELPESIGMLPCLKALDLQSNNLGQARNWNFLNSPFMRQNLEQLNLGDNKISRVPDAVMGLKNLKFLTLADNLLTELPSTMGKMKNLRCLVIARNSLRILPSWLYRKDRFDEVRVDRDDFNRELFCDIVPEHQPLRREDFVNVVPSLCDIIVKSIYTNSLPYWEYNLPDSVTDYVEAAYFCRCGSLVTRNTPSRVIRCWIGVCYLVQGYGDSHLISIAIRCCSYECYQNFKQYIE